VGGSVVKAIARRIVQEYGEKHSQRNAVPPQGYREQYFGATAGIGAGLVSSLD
jgi:hypothetical protein